MKHITLAFTLFGDEERTICLFLDHISGIAEARPEDRARGIYSYIWIDGSDNPFNIVEPYDEICQKIGSYLSEEYWNGNTEQPS
jgi:hypothetical protein